MDKPKNPYTIPDYVKVSSIYIDESGSRNSKGGFFVVGFVKVREPAKLARTVRDVRQRHKFYNEIHFAQISKKKLPFYFDLVESLALADVRVGGSVYDSKNSFNDQKETWEQQADMATLLVRGNINRNEIVNVFLDLVQTPRDYSAADRVKKAVNRQLHSRAVVEAYDIDSKSTDLIQLADIVASSINFERCNPNRTDTPKAQVALRLRRALNLDSFDDIQAGKVNIRTLDKSNSNH